MLGDGRKAPHVGVSAAVVAAAGLAVFAVVRWISRQKSVIGNRQAHTDREQLLAVLRELSRRFFLVCQDVAAIAKSVRPKLIAGQVDISEERLREQLARQCKVFEKLQMIQNEVALKFGISPHEIEDMQSQASQDPDVLSFSSGFRAMLEDALIGLSPILPNARIPEGLSEEKALKILAEVQTKEVEKVLEIVGSKQLTLQDLGQVLAASHSLAWEDVLQGYSDLLNGEGHEVYHSTVAQYSRNEDFAKEKKKLEDEHQQHMIRIFQPDGHGRVSATRC